MKPTTLTIAILTHNEAEQIEACIQSAKFANEILVIDSGSTDDTTNIAKRLGATVHIYDNWEGFAAQRNRQIEHLSSEWVFFLDADEVISSELADEILQKVRLNEESAYEVAWLQVAFGRPLKYMRSGNGIPRLFPKRVLTQFTGVVHETAELTRNDIPYKQLKHKLLHHSRRSIHQSLLKLAQYSQLGSAKRAAQGKRGGILRGTASAITSFIRTYFFHRGFMCGPEGFLHCFLVALESFFRYAALRYDRDQLQTLVKR